MILPDDMPHPPRLPLDRDGEPVFTAPWEARVFAMTLQAHEAGVFSWSEWAEALGAELALDGDGSRETSAYYDHWINAFEKLLAAKGVAPSSRLSELKTAWDEAARATPHGQPIVLGTR